jgi:hypothetical protein
MNSTVTDLQNGPATMATSLLETLQQEMDCLVRLYGHFDLQIEAIRRRSNKLIENTTHDTNEEVIVLARLKQARDRQLRLLGRVLRMEGDPATVGELALRLAQGPETRQIASQITKLVAKIKEQAKFTQGRCRDLEFALQYAVHLSRELLQAIQGIDQPAGGRHYTAKGGTVESAGTRSLLNRVG